MIGLRDPRMFGGMAGPLPQAAPAVPPPLPPAQMFAPEAAGITHLPMAHDLAPASGPAKLPGRMYLGAALMGMGGQSELAQALLQKKKDELAMNGQNERRGQLRDQLAKALIMSQYGG